MRIPKTLKIGALPFAVKWCEELRNQKGEKLWGQRDPTTCEIRLENCIRELPVQLFVTVLHEVLHEIADQYACKLSEENVERLSHGLAAFLLDNRLLKD